MGILSSILGTGDVVKEGFKLIDSIHTSDVEEIEAKTKAKTELLAAYAPFKVAQRYLALAFTATYLLFLFLVLTITLYHGGTVEDIRAILAEFNIGWIMLTIVGFYFAGGTIAGGFHKQKGGKD